jgi:hypothetical protein
MTDSCDLGLGLLHCLAKLALSVPFDPRQH